MNVMELDTRGLIKEFVNQSHKKYGSYAHAAGFLESHCAFALDLLPKHQKERFLQSLREKIYEYSGS